MWNERYAAPGFAYGTAPNDFLAAHLDQLPAGARVLVLADGEGRNGVAIAASGREVTSVDQAEVGLAKAQQLAAQRGVTITTIAADLADFPLQPDSWDAIVSIFCHLPLPLRAQLHTNAVHALRSGGVFLLEAYTPDQLQHGTGGPRTADLLMTVQELRHELHGLDFSILHETTREIHEGAYHNGLSAVVQVLAVKP